MDCHRGGSPNARVRRGAAPRPKGRGGPRRCRVEPPTDRPVAAGRCPTKALCLVDRGAVRHGLTPTAPPTFRIGSGRVLRQTGGVSSRQGQGAARRRVDVVVDRLLDAVEEPWPLHRMAQVAGYAPHHFHRLFSATMGETPHRFVSRVRVERAAALLHADPGLSLTEAAAAAGFSSPSQLSREFRARFGTTASGWDRGGPLHDRAEHRVLADLPLRRAPPGGVDAVKVLSPSTFLSSPPAPNHRPSLLRPPAGRATHVRRARRDPAQLVEHTPVGRACRDLLSTRGGVQWPLRAGMARCRGGLASDLAVQPSLSRRPGYAHAPTA